MPNRKIKTGIIAGAVLLLTCSATLLFLRHERAIHLERVKGAWEGAMHFHGGPLLRTQRMVLTIIHEKSSYRARLDEIDMGRKNTVAHFHIGGTAVDIELVSGFSYHGSLNGDATEITGRWKWPGGKYSQPLAFTRTNAPDYLPAPLAEAEYTARPGSDMQGLWKTTLKLPNSDKSLRLHLKITEPSRGTFRGELNSLDQPPIIPLPVTVLTYEKPRVKFALQGIGVAFDGELNDAGSQIVGKWTQAGTTAMTFDRVNPADEAKAVN